MKMFMIRMVWIITGMGKVRMCTTCRLNNVISVNERKDCVFVWTAVFLFGAPGGRTF